MNERKCKNCTYALAFFDADEPDKKSKTLCVCDYHLFAGTAEGREGRRA